MLIVLGTTLITFAIVYLVPGDPARVVAGPRADAQTIASIRAELGLDQPLWVQYGRYVALPALVLGVGTGAYYARLLHTNLVAVLGEEYIRAARARGVGRLKLLTVHALRNAALPFITVLGLDLAALLNGVVLTETVFHWP